MTFAWNVSAESDDGLSHTALLLPSLIVECLAQSSIALDKAGGKNE
jgi:hypothetical protein